MKPWVIVSICALLTAITWAVFSQTLTYPFVTYDDPQYVYANPDVSAGVSLGRISWAFTHTIAGNWHPLTTISHMLDCQLYGLKPAGHHFTNVFLHTTAVILLFLLLRAMTGAFWQSFFVAALFAIHPLHVESVAWISERKDVLSAVFFMLTLGAYVRYARKPSVTSYLLVFLLFALGLMSKPMLVTVPFVLLLLDYWPLGRVTHVGFPKALKRQQTSNSQWPVVRGLIAEKIPLFMLSIFSSVVTLFTQFQSTRTISKLPLPWRLNNAAVSYVVYIWQLFWPVRLAAFYPHPNGQFRLWQPLLSVVFLIVITLLVIHKRKELPYILTGWFWYLGMLVPVIGLVQAGEQARADRYTYLPQIGLYVLITWAITDLISSLTAGGVPWRLTTTASRSANFQRRKTPASIPPARLRRRRDNLNVVHKTFCAVMVTVVIISLSWRAVVQTSYWKDSETLWNHALDVTGDNDVADQNLGFLFMQRGDFDSAISHLETALKIRSRNAASHYNSGSALIENTLASVLKHKGWLNEAADHYENAMRLRPTYGDPYLNLGNVLLLQGRMPDAITQWQKAHATEPKDARFHTALGDAFLGAGLQQDAIAEYEYATRISAQDPLPRNKLAWLLATSLDASIRDGSRAVEVANEAVRLSHGKDPNYVRTLAAAFAEAGRFVEAEEAARRAVRAAELMDNRSLVNALRDEIALYELGLPCHR